ncbi:hypothetical protein RCDURKIN_88 [Rhodobacter phage RcDurkin]|nr:hypothetical protein RCDURKIN_88 [Rhodobacter phage RcDurkin]
MNSILATTTVNGKTVSVYHDTEPDDPRQYMCGAVVAFSMGIETSPKSKFHGQSTMDFVSALTGGEHESFISVTKAAIEADMTPDELFAKLAKERGYPIVVPLYCYRHGLVALSLTPFACKWDSAQVGFLVISNEELVEYGFVKDGSAPTKEEIDLTLEEAKKDLSLLQDYLNGDVYRVVIEDDVSGEQIECYGSVYGDPDQIVKDVINELA